MTVDIIPDKKYDIDNVKLGYMEDYFLDEDSQLEKRLAIGDSSFLDGLKDKDKKIMIGNINFDFLLFMNDFLLILRYHKGYSISIIDAQWICYGIPEVCERSRDGNSNSVERDWDSV